MVHNRSPRCRKCRLRNAVNCERIIAPVSDVKVTYTNASPGRIHIRRLGKCVVLTTSFFVSSALLHIQQRRIKKIRTASKLWINSKTLPKLPRVNSLKLPATAYVSMEQLLRIVPQLSWHDFSYDGRHASEINQGKRGNILKYKCHVIDKLGGIVPLTLDKRFGACQPRSATNMKTLQRIHI